jgi:hypothetical protein
MGVAISKFSEVPAGPDVTRLEASVSFLQIKSSISLHKKIPQVKHKICQSRRRPLPGGQPLQPVASVRVGHHHHQEQGSGLHDLVQPSGGGAQGQSPLHKGDPCDLEHTSLFVDQISYAIKSATSPTWCNNIAPPWWNITWRGYCAHPSPGVCSP